MILVIGYGNPLCGDDGIGPYVVERLADDESPADVEYLTLRQLTPELAEPVSQADTVIFVDAADGGTTGEITCHKLTLSAEPSETAPGAFTHHVNAAALLEIARLLYGRHPVAYLFKVAGENFELGDSFSSGVESALPLLLDQLKAKITRSER